MARTINEIIASLPKADRDKIEARARELVAEEMTLRRLREAMNKTQVTVAKRLRVRQDTVSKIEARTDMLLSTLRGYVRAIGGELELVATFPDRAPIRVSELGQVSSRRKKPSRARARSAA